MSDISTLKALTWHVFTRDYTDFLGSFLLSYSVFDF